MPVDSLLMPKLSTSTKASGDSMITHFRMPGPNNIAGAPSHWANSRATMPVSSTPEVM